MENIFLTALTTPEVRAMFREELERFFENFEPKQTTQLPKYVNIHEAAKIAGKTENALRVQVSLGKLKSIKKGNRHYFERDYLERWIAGETDERRVA